MQLKLMAINYGGLVNIATATLPGMVQRGSGACAAPSVPGSCWS